RSVRSASMIPPAMIPKSGPDAALAEAILVSLDGLLHALELEALGADRFRVLGEPGRFDRVFGGQVVAQALLAAGATVVRKGRHSRMWVDHPPPLDLRIGEAPTFLGGAQADGARSHWMRLPRDVGDDPLLHAALLAYASDYLLLDMAFRSYPRGVTSPPTTGF